MYRKDVGLGEVISVWSYQVEVVKGAWRIVEWKMQSRSEHWRETPMLKQKKLAISRSHPRLPPHLDEGGRSERTYNTRNQREFWEGLKREWELLILRDLEVSVFLVCTVKLLTVFCTVQPIIDSKSLPR